MFNGDVTLLFRRPHQSKTNYCGLNGEGTPGFMRKELRLGRLPWTGFCAVKGRSSRSMLCAWRADCLRFNAGQLQWKGALGAESGIYMAYENLESHC